MRYLTIILILAISSLLGAADIDLSDVELSSKSQVALTKFETSLEKENQIYLKKVNSLRAKCLKTMTSDSKKQKDVMVALKIKEKITEIADLAPIDIFGNVIDTPEDKIKKLVVGGWLWGDNKTKFNISEDMTSFGKKVVINDKNEATLVNETYTIEVVFNFDTDPVSLTGVRSGDNLAVTAKRID